MESNMGIWISDTAFRTLSPSLQEALIQSLTGSNMLKPSGTSKALLQNLGTEEPADLSVAQAKRFLEGCGEKTTMAIRIAVAGDSPFFQLADIAKALKVEAMQLAGVWTGITKRTRTVLGDSEARLFWWEEGGQKYDDQGTFIDQKGWVSVMTYHSFRKALNIG